MGVLRKCLGSGATAQCTLELLVTHHRPHPLHSCLLGGHLAERQAFQEASHVWKRGRLSGVTLVTRGEGVPLPKPFQGSTIAGVAIHRVGFTLRAFRSSVRDLRFQLTVQRPYVVLASSGGSSCCAAAAHWNFRWSGWVAPSDPAPQRISWTTGLVPVPCGLGTLLRQSHSLVSSRARCCTKLDRCR